MSPVSVEIDAPAKVNLWLRVLAREEEGYHGLETLFCAIDLCDGVRVEPGGSGVRCEVEGTIDTGPVDDNLAVRAARAALRELGREGDAIRIRLTKCVPAAAGLGGGSSDAAAVLRAVNRMYGSPLAAATLLQLGIELGSDVPFFLGGSPLALAWSRGERLLPLPPLPAAHLLVAHPGVALSTGAAFGRLAELRGPYRPEARSISPDDLTTWPTVSRLAVNDFEPVATERIPRVAEGLSRMRAAGASIALLAGSGAAIFGVFDDESALAGAESELRGAGLATWRTRTRTRMPEPVVTPVTSG